MLRQTLACLLMVAALAGCSAPGKPQAPDQTPRASTPAPSEGAAPAPVPVPATPTSPAPADAIRVATYAPGQSLVEPGLCFLSAATGQTECWSSASDRNSPEAPAAHGCCCAPTSTTGSTKPVTT